MNNKVSEKIDLCQISLTGARAIILLGLLMKAPLSLEEIKEIFINNGLMTEEGSDDVLRIDMNTLKAMGCEISRASRKTNHKYVLLKHPFLINLSEEELAIIRQAYKKNRNNLSVEELIKYDSLFENLANQVISKSSKEFLYGLSTIKMYNKDLLKELQQSCKQHQIIKLIYHPATKKQEERNIYAQKLMFQSDKIYLLGKDIENEEQVMFNIKRILKILSRSSCDDNIEIKNTKIKFILKNFGITGILEEETIKESSPNGYIIEGNYHNDFIALQRILSFGPSCTVLEPTDFKEKVIEKLKSMRSIYND